MNVLLRKWTISDCDQLVLLANNKKIWDNVRDYFPHPYTLLDAEEWILKSKDEKPVTNFAVEADGALAGGCGIILKEDVYRCNAEIGYWIGEPFWRKGIATIAIGQLVTHIKNTFPHIVRIYAETFAFNKASMRVLKKNGFHQESIREKAVIKNNSIVDDHIWVLFTDK